MFGMMARARSGPNVSPALISAGTGTGIDGNGALAPAYQSNGSGYLWVCHIASYRVSYATPSGWALVVSRSDQDAFTGNLFNHLYVRNERATGSDSGAVTFNTNGDGAGSEWAAARFYLFGNVSGYEAVTSIGPSTGAATGTAQGPTLATTKNHRLACAFPGGYCATMAAITGNSGGIWTKQADYGKSRALDSLLMVLNLDTLDMPAPSTISGGLASMTGLSFWGNTTGFALVGM